MDCSCVTCSRYAAVPTAAIEAQMEANASMLTGDSRALFLDARDVLACRRKAEYRAELAARKAAAPAVKPVIVRPVSASTSAPVFGGKVRGCNRCRSLGRMCDLCAHDA